jgi:hypothetical protein
LPKATASYARGIPSSLSPRRRRSPPKRVPDTLLLPT